MGILFRLSPLRPSFWRLDVFSSGPFGFAPWGFKIALFVLIQPGDKVPPFFLVFFYFFSYKLWPPRPPMPFCPPIIGVMFFL